MQTLTPQEKYKSLIKLMEQIDDLQKNIPKAGKDIIELFEGKLYVPHFLFLASLNRTLNLNDAILNAIGKWNFIVAAALLRMQLETLSSLIYVNHSNIAQQSEFYIKEGRLKKLEIIGDHISVKSLRDSELVDFASKTFPWIANVYKETSRIIHFSDKHIYAMTTNFDDKEATFEWKIGIGNETWQEKDIKELLLAVIKINKEILNYILIIAKKFKKGLQNKS